MDTGEKRDLRGRRMTPTRHRAEIVEAYRASGLKMAAFARRERIKYGTFTGWVSKAQTSVAPWSPIKFAEAQLLCAPTSGQVGDVLEVRLVDGTVLRGSRVADLVLLVRALRS